MRMFSTVSAAFWTIVLAAVALFAFFLALGAFSPGETTGVTAVVAALAVLWFGHALWVSRHAEGRDPDAIRARERRGF
jgi:hypothetical protein